MPVWAQRAQRLDFPSLNTDARAQDPEVLAQESVSCHWHSAAPVARSRRGSTLLNTPQCTRVHSEACREGSRAKSQSRSWHVPHSAQTPSDQSLQMDHKPGLPCLTVIIHSPTAMKAALYGLSSHLHQVAMSILCVPEFCPCISEPPCF